MITVTIDGVEHEFHGDELTSATSQAIIFLQDQQQKEMVV